VQFGMLSVNNREVGAIGGPQRAVIIAMAKVLAMATAASCGAKALIEEAENQTARDAFPTMSATGATVAAVEEGSRT